MRRRNLSLPIIGGLAGAAMLAAHWLAYLIAAPDAHERAHLLAASGHAYWVYIAAAGLGGGVLAMAGFVRSRLQGSAAPTHPSKIAMKMLAPFQVISFAVLEGAERVATGQDLLTTFIEPVVLIGIVLQLVVALLGGLLLGAVALVVARIKGTRRHHRAVPRGLYPLVSQDCPPPLVAAGGPTLRGPPLLVRV